LQEIKPENLTVKDYQKVKDLQKQLGILIKEHQEAGELTNKALVTLLQESLEALEKNIPEQVKNKEGRKKVCREHKNII